MKAYTRPEFHNNLAKKFYLDTFINNIFNIITYRLNITNLTLLAYLNAAIYSFLQKVKIKGKRISIYKEASKIYNRTNKLVDNTFKTWLARDFPFFLNKISFQFIDPSTGEPKKAFNFNKGIKLSILLTLAYLFLRETIDGYRKIKQNFNSDPPLITYDDIGKKYLWFLSNNLFNALYNCEHFAFTPFVSFWKFDLSLPANMSIKKVNKKGLHYVISNDYNCFLKIYQNNFSLLKKRLSNIDYGDIMESFLISFLTYYSFAIYEIIKYKIKDQRDEKNAIVESLCKELLSKSFLRSLNQIIIDKDAENWLSFLTFPSITRSIKMKFKNFEFITNDDEELQKTKSFLKIYSEIIEKGTTIEKYLTYKDIKNSFSPPLNTIINILEKSVKITEKALYSFDMLNNKIFYSLASSILLREINENTNPINFLIPVIKNKSLAIASSIKSPSQGQKRRAKVICF